MHEAAVGIDDEAFRRKDLERPSNAIGDDSGRFDRSRRQAREPLPGLYASWGRRFVAWAVDAILLFAIAAALMVVAGATGSTSHASGGLLLAALLLVPLVYVVGFTGGPRGQTPGKRLLGISVRHGESLGRLGYGRAFGRWLVTAVFWWLFVVPALIDVLWPLSDRENRALHDLVAGSVVIRL